MRVFLQFSDEKVWLAIEVGWTKPTDPSAPWDDNYVKVANFNSQALNALFSAMTNKEFKKISSTESVNLKDIVNFAFNLSEKILEPKIVRKILRSLPEQFHAKITTIEESKDIDAIPLTEHIGNLQTYELGLKRIGKGSKSKNMALKAKIDEGDESFKDENSKFNSYITKLF